MPVARKTTTASTTPAAAPKAAAKRTTLHDSDEVVEFDGSGGDAEEDDHAAGSPGGEGGSLEDIFDNAKAQGTIPPGKYEALIVEAVLQEPDAKGQSVRFKYEIADEGESQGQQIAQWYKIVEADGRTPSKGLPILKKDLGILGFPDIKFRDFEEALQSLQDEMVGVQITVKQNGQYTNVYIQSVLDGSEICDEWRANRAAEQP